MARAPSAAGKTRLSSSLSAARLTALRAALLADTLDVIAAAARAGGVEPVLVFTPAGAESEVAALTNHHVPCLCQSDGDLGQRMRAAFEELLGPRGYDAAMLVGADIPLLHVRHVLDARDTLHLSGGVVLGPADDGGYYLIGMTTVHGGLFDRIEWGTDSVLTDTLRAAERLGIETRLIDSTYDVDRIEDLRRVERDLPSMASGIAPHLRRWFVEDGV
jgi:rSAM/selenodomain-associated transferase 1